MTEVLSTRFRTAMIGSGHCAPSRPNAPPVGALAKMTPDGERVITVALAGQPNVG
jgi:hypothetical protein